ncbi:hypothetical protein DM02DRAFT_536497 [Periconia macrospinosa]|uniref:Rhodopsin domain-containing protein n=1 Tax=Periconia macrospinosa TaxID=97972 RepID=A0A2V1DCS0_9PLEO|nr:hypothetical protein DM02DRAFT_536497 [Periconia macrospinosa]
MAQSLKELFSLGEIFFFLSIGLLVVSWIAVALRIWVRVSITKSPGWDDAAIIFTLCLFTCYVSFLLVLIMSARDMRAFTPNQIKETLRWVQLSEVFYILTTTFLKMSLGLFFLRLLTKPWQRYLFHTTLVITALYGVFYFLATVLVCGSPSNAEGSFAGSRSCASTDFILSTGYIYGIINVLSDWTFTLVPILILIESDMCPRSKIVVSFVIAFAAIGSVSSIMRMVYLKGLLLKTGLTVESVKATIWATAEPGTGIIASSVAILRPLFRKIALKFGNKTNNNCDPKVLPAPPVTNDQESVVGLKSMDMKSKERRSSISDDVWDADTSYDLTLSGRPITITVGAGEGVAPVSPKRL